MNHSRKKSVNLYKKVLVALAVEYHALPLRIFDHSLKLTVTPEVHEKKFSCSTISAGIAAGMQGKIYVTVGLLLPAGEKLRSCRDHMDCKGRFINSEVIVLSVGRIYRHIVADPGFPKRGANPKGVGDANLLICQISPKTA